MSKVGKLSVVRRASPRLTGPVGVSVVIPCLNEAETIERCVRDAAQALKGAGLKGEVVVADNGSTDGSQDLARAAGAKVVIVEARGYGAALHGGISAACFDLIVIADGDLSYPFAALVDLIEPIKQGVAEFVLGNRLNSMMDSGAMPLLNRVVGTPLLSWLIRRLHRLPTSDCNSGMRAFFRADYSRFQPSSRGMEYASEMLIRAGRIGLAYHEVPIHFRKDQRSRPSHLSRWRDGWRHLKVIVRRMPPAQSASLPHTGLPPAA